MSIHADVVFSKVLIITWKYTENISLTNEEATRHFNEQNFDQLIVDFIAETLR